MDTETATTAAATTTTNTTTTDRNEIIQMKKMLLDTKVDGGKKSIWSMTIETFSMADGKHKKEDIIVTTIDDGLELLNDYVKQRDAEKKNKKSMDLVPLSEFNATQDQFLASFLKWAEKEAEEEDGDNNGSKKKTKINVSKACRRLDSYFEWMEDNKENFEEPLTIDSISKTAKLWDIQITYDTENDNKFVWWIDLGKLDKEEIKKVSSKDHLRYVVWFSHLVMLDSNAQRNGAMIIEDMGHLSFWKLATLVPSDLSAKMDRLTIGILPVKMKKIYVFGAARWMTLLMTLLKPFMGKKMRNRMQLIPNATDMQLFCDNLLQSRKNIPINFCNIIGEAKRDGIFDKFLSK